jgi:hypothetical protein
MTKTQQIEHRTKVFDDCMRALASIYAREFHPAAVRAYFVAVDGWGEDKIRAAFQKAFENEKFCPPPASIRAYGAAIHDEAPAVLPRNTMPQYTPEQRAELDAWKREFAASFVPPPWMRDDPGARRRRA